MKPGSASRSRSNAQIPGFPSGSRLLAVLTKRLRRWLPERNLSLVHAYAEWFIRKGISERRQIIYDPSPKERVTDDLQVGDLILELDGYRQAEGRVATWGLTPTESVCDCSGYGVVRKSVSQWIEHPDLFYDGLYEIPDFYTVELDPWVHQHVLQRATGGRPVSLIRNVRLHYDHYAKAAFLYIIGPIGLDTHPQYGEQVVLDRNTPSEYLSDATWLQVDPIVEEERRRNREIHEQKAHAYWRSLTPGVPVGIQSLPNLGGSTRWGQAQFHSCRADANGKVTDVSLYDGSVFRPQVVIDRGPFGGVLLWIKNGFDPTAELDLVWLHSPVSQ